MKSTMITEDAQDQTFVEADFAHLLDELAVELHEIADELRRSPYSAVEQRLDSFAKKFAWARNAGHCISIPQEGAEVASKLIQEIRSL